MPRCFQAQIMFFTTLALACTSHSEAYFICECRYELSRDLTDALEHAQAHGVNSKVMLCMADVGVTY